MFTRKRDTSFAAFAQEVANPHEALQAWNEAAYRVVDNSHARRAISAIGTGCYAFFTASMARFVNTNLIINGDVNAIAATTIALLPIFAGTAYTIHQTYVGVRGMKATILPTDPMGLDKPALQDKPVGDIQAQHPKVYAKAKRLREKSANQIGVAHYQM